MSALEQSRAAQVKAFSGQESNFDVGINWYLNRHKLKLALHYSWNVGDPGDAPAGNTINQYFAQGALGAIRRGNWWGLGMNWVL